MPVSIKSLYETKSGSYVVFSQHSCRIFAFGVQCTYYTNPPILYGDNVFEKCGINRDGAGEVGKPRYFNGKRHF